MATNFSIPMLIENTSFLNWTRILSYNRNVTKHHISNYNDDDANDDVDVSTVVIVGVGIVLMVVMWVWHDWVRADRPKSWCFRSAENVDSVPLASTAEPVPSAGGLAAGLALGKRKESPPPPYEHPPTYHHAIQVEREENKRDL